MIELVRNLSALRDIELLQSKSDALKKRTLLLLRHCLFFLVIGSVIASCKMKTATGYVEITAPQDGVYEIYKVASKEPLQFVAEQVGYFNKKVELATGNYLILADCSSLQVIVNPGSTKHLIAHRVEFIPPFQPALGDKFSIQCNRFSETKSRQQFTNRYLLNVLQGGKREELLIGMVPWQVDFNTNLMPTESKVIKLNLAAVQVASFEGMDLKTSYYISPSNGLISVTEPQDFGHWQLLLPGSYIVEANGTKVEVSLKEGEQKIIYPAFLNIHTPSNTPLYLSSQITGSPLFVELNSHHWLDFNETYPLLPGRIKLRLNGSTVVKEIDLQEKELFSLQTRSIQVNSDCSPWEWQCLGSRNVYLYETGSQSPFTVSVTDVPILFFENDVWIGIQGARDIRYLAPPGSPNFQLGKIRFSPKIVLGGGQATDLARVESVGNQMSGNTLDLQLDQPTVMRLIEGSYSFSQYISMIGTEPGERRHLSKTFKIQKDKAVDMPFSVLMSEKKFNQRKSVDSSHDTSEVSDRKRLVKYYRPSIPLHIE